MNNRPCGRYGLPVEWPQIKVMYIIVKEFFNSFFLNRSTKYEIREKFLSDELALMSVYRAVAMQALIIITGRLRTMKKAQPGGLATVIVYNAMQALIIISVYDCG